MMSRTNRNVPPSAVVVLALLACACGQQASEATIDGWGSRALSVDGKPSLIVPAVTDLPRDVQEQIDSLSQIANDDAGHRESALHMIDQIRYALAAEDVVDPSSTLPKEEPFDPTVVYGEGVGEFIDQVPTMPEFVPESGSKNAWTPGPWGDFPSFTLILGRVDGAPTLVLFGPLPGGKPELSGVLSFALDGIDTDAAMSFSDANGQLTIDGLKSRKSVDEAAITAAVRSGELHKGEIKSLAAFID